MKFIKTIPRRYIAGSLMVVACAVLGAWLASVWPVMLSGIYDKVSVGTVDFSTVKQDILLFGAVYIAAELINIGRRIGTDNVTATFEKEMRNKSIVKLLHLPADFYTENISGEYTARINQAVAGASQLLKVVLNNAVPSLLISGFTVYQVVRKAPIFIAVILITYIIVEVIISAFQIKSQRGIRELLVSF